MRPWFVICTCFRGNPRGRRQENKKVIMPSWSIKTRVSPARGNESLTVILDTGWLRGPRGMPAKTHRRASTTARTRADTGAWYLCLMRVYITIPHIPTAQSRCRGDSEPCQVSLGSGRALVGEVLSAQPNYILGDIPVWGCRGREAGGLCTSEEVDVSVCSVLL